ncbi:MAG: NAD(P)/FAD-dependent oxidoreductase, partial [Gammaproteobacteria bacterium]|nr:NAD(P)/FAD-dependent oxidoreductase [Gammaproteobacteria bacterium]
VCDQLVILEKESDFGQGISSRNSEVIHAGIYYPAASEKAVLCVRGKQLLYDYCRQKGISHKRTGKFIVATSIEEESILEAIIKKGEANGVDDLEIVSEKQLKQKEPDVAARSAIWSPSTGIVSAHDLMTALLAETESRGGVLATHARVTSIVPDSSGLVLRVGLSGNDSYELHSRIVINAAGLGASGVSTSVEGLSPDRTPPLYYCKGNYFTLTGKAPFKHLVYPVPDPSGAGLGVHATLDMGGQVKFGPDVEYIDSENYQVSTGRLESYYEAIRRYYPGLPEGALEPSYAGIRPKTTGPGEPAQDFTIQSEDEAGIPGLIQLFGIESPGLTAALAIGEKVRRMAVLMLE